MKLPITQNVVEKIYQSEIERSHWKESLESIKEFINSEKIDALHNSINKISVYGDDQNFHHDSSEKYESLYYHFLSQIFQNAPFKIKDHADDLRKILDWIPYGIFFLDKEKNITYKNKKSHIILTKGDILQEKENSIFCKNADDLSLLLKLINHCQNNTNANNIYNQFITLKNSNDAKDYLNIFVFQKNNDALIFFIISSKEDFTHQMQLYKEVFNLTPMQAKVVTQISFGLDSKEITDIYNISKDTLKSHLKNIYEKTNTKNQRELIQLLLRISVPLISEEEK